MGKIRLVIFVIFIVNGASSFCFGVVADQSQNSAVISVQPTGNGIEIVVPKGIVKEDGVRLSQFVYKIVESVSVGALVLILTMLLNILFEKTKIKINDMQSKEVKRREIVYNLITQFNQLNIYFSRVISVVNSSDVCKAQRLTKLLNLYSDFETRYFDMRVSIESAKLFVGLECYALFISIYDKAGGFFGAVRSDSSLQSLASCVQSVDDIAARINDEMMDLKRFI